MISVHDLKKFFNLRQKPDQSIEGIDEDDGIYIDSFRNNQ